MKKGKGRLIHVSEFIEEENGRLAVRDEHGNVIREARRIIYPGGSSNVPYWDHNQLLEQVEDTLDILVEAYPTRTGLFIFDQSSAHATLGPDAIRPFQMNKSNGGKQPFQHDTVIPDTNPVEAKRGQPQSMKTASGEQKGLKDVLEERGFNVSGMRTKCAPICPIENERCCMARLLSNQADVKNQVSLLEQMIVARGHLCMFLPKFHCELNPIEMVSCIYFCSFLCVLSLTNTSFSIGDGLSTGIVKSTRKNSRTRRFTPNSVSMHVLWRSSDGSSTVLGGSWMRTRRG